MDCFYDYIRTDAQKRPDLVNQKELAVLLHIATEQD